MIGARRAHKGNKVTLSERRGRMEFRLSLTLPQDTYWVSCHCLQTPPVSIFAIGTSVPDLDIAIYRRLVRNDHDSSTWSSEKSLANRGK